MTAVPGFAFSCDSRDGCSAHAMVAGDSVKAARDALMEVLGWFSSEHGDLCPTHGEQRL